MKSMDQSVDRHAPDPHAVSIAAAVLAVSMNHAPGEWLVKAPLDVITAWGQLKDLLGVEP